MFNQEALNRPLGHAEASIWKLDRLSHLNGVVAARLRGRLSESTLRTSLDALQARHPMCQVRVIDFLDGEPQFTSLDVPSIPLWVRGDAPQSVAKVLQDELDHGLFHETGPLIRCALYRYGRVDSLLTLTYHLSAIDAPSSLLLLRDLLRLCGGDGATQIRTLVPLQSKGSLDELKPHVNRGLRGLFRALGLLIRQARAYVIGRPPASPKPNVPTGPVEERFSVATRSLDRVQTQILVGACERSQCSPYAAVCSSMLMAMGQEIDPKGSVRLDLAHIIDLREETRPHIGEDVGMFSGLIHRVRATKAGDNVWRVATQETLDLKSADRRGEAWSSPTAARMLLSPLDRITGGVEGNAALFRERLRRYADPALVAADLGDVELFSHTGELRVESLTVVNKPALGGIYLSVHQFQGRLEWSICFPTPTFHEHRMQTLMDRTLMTLVGALGIQLAA